MTTEQLNDLSKVISKLDADNWNGTREHAYQILESTVLPVYTVKLFNEWADNLQIYKGCPTVLCADCKIECIR